MGKINRTETVKIRVTPSEKRKLERIALDGGKSMSEMIREKAFHPGTSGVKEMEKEVQQNQEKEARNRLIVARIMSAFNQMKAGVNADKALSDMEREVKELWQALK